MSTAENGAELQGKREKIMKKQEVKKREKQPGAVEVALQMEIGGEIKKQL